MSTDIEKDLVEEIILNPKQIDYFIDLYRDNDKILGIHKTLNEYKAFFKKGLFNQNSMNINSDDLSNSIYYSTNLIPLLSYVKESEERAIILKIPKDVFTNKQGIIEKDKFGKYYIPTQFIFAAFQDGEIYVNPYYDENYVNEDAIKCWDNQKITDFDRGKQIKNYRKYEKKYKRPKISDKIKTFFNKFLKKQKALEEPEEELSIEEKVQIINDNLRKSSICEKVKEPDIGERSRFVNSNDLVKEDNDIEK